MRAEVETFFADPEATVHRCETTDADYGHIEARRHAVSQHVAWLASDHRFADEAAMPGLAAIAMVEPEVERDGRTTTSRRCYLSSAALTSELFTAAVRARPLNDRERRPLGPRHRLRRGPGPKPQGPRRRKPRRHPQTRPHRHLHPPQAQMLRMLQCLSQDPSSANCDDPGTGPHDPWTPPSRMWFIAGFRGRRSGF